MVPAPLVFSSIRDILAPPSNAKKAEQTEAWLAEHYDGVLVHSDAGVVPLEASWPVTPQTARLLHYTGFIAPPMPPRSPPEQEGAGEILVTAGGGPVGRKLFETSIDAARIGGQRWRLLVGGGDAAAVCARLNDAANGAPVFAEPLRADYRAMLTRCAAAVGQCGYNTAIDWLQAGVPGVFVPFAEAGEVEQTLRAASLQERYGYGQIAEDELTPENLAAADDGRRQTRTLQGERTEVRRRRADQPHPRRPFGRARMTRQLPAAPSPNLTRWRDEGRTLPIWWRDDDAIAPTPALERLLALAERFERAAASGGHSRAGDGRTGGTLESRFHCLCADAWLAARKPRAA